MQDVVRVVPFEGLRMTDVQSVGGKNASLGEMIGQLAHAGIRVPGGFATTAAAKTATNRTKCQRRANLTRRSTPGRGG